MMNLTNIIFRLLDFFVIIILFTYGIRHYVLPFVHKKLKDYQLFIETLDADYKKLQIENHGIYEKIQDQDRNFQTMQEKFVIWKEKCNQGILVEKIEQEKIDQNMCDRFEVRSDFVKNSLALKEQLPEIFDTVTYDLQSKYRVLDTQKKYIDALIDSMKDFS